MPAERSAEAETDPGTADREWRDSIMGAQGVLLLYAHRSHRIRENEEN
jgi:hypothetical protein